MTSTRTNDRSTSGNGSRFGGPLFAVVLVAAWMGALAIPSAPSSEGRPPSTSVVHQPSAVPVVSTEAPATSSQQFTPAF